MKRTLQQWEEFRPPSMGYMDEIEAMREAREDILELYKILLGFQASLQIMLASIEAYDILGNKNEPTKT